MRRLAPRSGARRRGARVVPVTGGSCALTARAYDDTLGLRIAQVCYDQAPDLWAERRAGYDPRDLAAVDGLIRDLSAWLARLLPVHEFLLDDWYAEVDSVPAGGADLDELPPYHIFLPVLYPEPYELDPYEDDVPEAEALLALAALGGDPQEAAALARRLDRAASSATNTGRAHRVVTALVGNVAAAQRIYDDAAGAFARAPAPLDAVPRFLRYVTATTGNRWLDDAGVEACGYEEVPWMVDAVRQARASCEAAARYIAPLRALRAHLSTPQGCHALLDLIDDTLDQTGDRDMTTETRPTIAPESDEVTHDGNPAAAAAPDANAAAGQVDGVVGVVGGARPDPAAPPALPERRPGYIQVEECAARAFGLHQLIGVAEPPALEPGTDGADEDGGAVEVTLSLSRRWGFIVKTLHDERGLPYLHSMISAGDITAALVHLSRRPALKEEGTFLDLPAGDNRGCAIKGVYIPGRRIAPVKQVVHRNVRFDEMPIPHHIILVRTEGQRRTFYMWAVRHYPSSPKDLLYAMPLNNVMDRSGWVCVGDVALPQARRHALHVAAEHINLHEIDRVLLDESRYTNAYNADKSKAHPRSLDALWRWLATLPPEQAYPYDDLVPVGTIEDILSGGLGGWVG